MTPSLNKCSKLMFYFKSQILLTPFINLTDCTSEEKLLGR